MKVEWDLRVHGTAAPLGPHSAEDQAPLHHLTLCVVSDTHGFHGTTRCPLADVLIHCGDFSQRGREKDEERLDTWLASQPHAIKLVLRGNHDSPRRGGIRKLAQSGAALVGNAHRLFKVAGVSFLVVPWKREHLDQQLPSPSFPEADVVLSHVPPFGILDRSHRGENVGSRPLLTSVAAWGQPPTLWCFGHVHEARGALSVALPAATGLRDEDRDQRYGRPLSQAPGPMPPPPNHGLHARVRGKRSGQETTVCLNASNANDGKAARWVSSRPPILVRLHFHPP